MANQHAEQLLDETIMAMEKFGWAFSECPFPVVVHSEGEVRSFEDIAKRPLADVRSNKLSNVFDIHDNIALPDFCPARCLALPTALPAPASLHICLCC